MFRIFPFTVPSLQQDVGLGHHCRRWLIHSEMQNAASHPCGRIVIHATFKRNYAYWDIPFCQVSAKQSIRDDGKVSSGTDSKNMGKKAQSCLTDCLHKFMGTLGNPSTVCTEYFVEIKPHTRLCSLEGSFGYNLYLCLL